MFLSFPTGLRMRSNTSRDDLLVFSYIHVLSYPVVRASELLGGGGHIHVTLTTKH